MNNADRILALLGQHSGLDDDELAKLAGISPRQQVNQICRRLAAAGLIVRARGISGKISNALLPERAPVRPDIRSRSPLQPDISSTSIVSNADLPFDSAENLRDTLLIIPCSGRKNTATTIGRGGAPITDSLPATLTQRLQDARATVLAKAELDENHLMPAWQRYAGTFYAAANKALVDAVAIGLHVLILSGGYGLVTAGEAIGNYAMRLNRRLRPAEWCKN
ncbi:MAG: MarR family transcriptional regulator [Proteobacteria bacterium]|nr:MarR family transcriptional regulator [Pseudomonadota bacterium]